MEKNISILSTEEAYALRLLHLERRSMQNYRLRMDQKTAKIKSHLTAVDIIKMKELEAAGKLKGVGNRMASASYAILAAAEKRLKPRPMTSLPVRQHSRNSLNRRESDEDDYQPKPLVKQASLSNLNQISENDSSAIQDPDVKWARPSPHRRPSTACVSSTCKASYEHRPPKMDIVIPTVEYMDDSVSDIEELQQDQESIPCDNDQPRSDNDIPRDQPPPPPSSPRPSPRPPPRPKCRRLPVTPNRPEGQDGVKDTRTKPDFNHQRDRCPYKGKPMRALPMATKVTVVHDDSQKPSQTAHQNRTVRPGSSSIPVRKEDVRTEKRRPQTAKQVTHADKTTEQEIHSSETSVNDISQRDGRPKTAKESPSLGYYEIYRNRRVRSPDYSRITSRRRSLQNGAEDTNPKRPVSRNLPIPPDRSPDTKIPTRSVMGGHREIDGEAAESKVVSPRRIIRPQTANPAYSSAISRNSHRYSAPNTMPREQVTTTNEPGENINTPPPKYPRDPSTQSATLIPRYVPIPPQQRANIVPRSPKVITIPVAKKLNPSVTDRVIDSTHILPYASPGNSVHNQTNQVPEVLQKAHTQSPEDKGETLQTYPTQGTSVQIVHRSNSVNDCTPTSAVPCIQHEVQDPENYRQPSSPGTGLSEHTRPETSIHRPRSDRCRTSARPDIQAAAPEGALSTARDFRGSLSRSYDTQEHVISAKPPRPMQRPTTARNHLITKDTQPTTRSSIPRPRTARVLPCTPQRLQLERYPNKLEGAVVTQAIIHCPKPPTAPPVRRMRVPDQAEYVAHDPTITAHSKMAARANTQRKPSLKFHFDCHKIPEPPPKEQVVPIPNAHASFEEAMADYLERVAADNIFSENVLHGFQQSLIKLEKLKIARIEDKMTLYLNKLDDYLERSGKVIPDGFKPLRFRKTEDESTVVTFDPAIYFKNRKKNKNQNNRSGVEPTIQKDADPDASWNGMNKCRYLRIPNDMMDNSGVRTLATNQLHILKPQKGID